MASAVDAIARIGVSVAAGHAAVQIGWGILAFLAIAIVRDVVTPVLRALGKGLAARLEARLMPERTDKDG